jgi:serine phosphatase RsbU (regulator of sigma subunit)
MIDESSAPMSVLLVEDDDADALLVAEHFADVEAVSGLTVTLKRVRTVAEVNAHAVGSVDCVLLDLALPDAHGLDALARVLRAGDAPAVVVLTGRHDEALGIQAVAAGAQDYLLKDAVDGAALTRALRYAAERVRGERVRRQLWDAQIRADENVRLERGLLPTPLLTNPDVHVAVRYQPGGERGLLGGDFYDTIESADGTLHVVIGDVCGHGPDEAALGVNLRIAWRAMVLNGADDDQLLPTLSRLLVHERDRTGIFATLALLTIDPRLRYARLRLAGHPPPILVPPDEAARPLPTTRLGRPIGIVLDDHWAVLDVALPARWALLLYTDGLVEGRPHEGAVRSEADDHVLDTDGLLAVLEECIAADRRPADRAVTDHQENTVTSPPNPDGPPVPPWHVEPDRLLDEVLRCVRGRTEERTDDVAAVLLVSRR